MNRRKFLVTSGAGLVGIAGLAAAKSLFIDTKKEMKHILVITGSPRKHGNSDLLADAFIKGAKVSGNEVLKFETAFKNLEKCRNCNHCFKTDDIACIFNDDFNELAKAMIQSDVIVFATPLYWWTYPSNLKTAIDKLFAFQIGEKLKLLEGKKVILLAVAGSTKREEFNILLQSHRALTTFHKWIDGGELIVPGVINKGDILHTKALAKAELLGTRV